MKVSIEGQELVIRLPLQRPTPSATGKTLIVASTHGNKPSEAQIDGKPVVVGVNAWIGNR